MAAMAHKGSNEAWPWRTWAGATSRNLGSVSGVSQTEFFEVQNAKPSPSIAEPNSASEPKMGAEKKKKRNPSPIHNF